MPSSPHVRRSEPLSRPRAAAPDAGSVIGSLLLAVLVVALVGGAAFYYFGGRADVNVKIKKSPNISVSSSPSPS